MASYIFQTIAKKGRAEGITPDGTKKAAKWFRERSMNVKQVNTKRLVREGDKLLSRLTIHDVGRMYHFFYDPKWKKELPYYDRFPLIFVIDKFEGGFMGINMHYIPPVMRAKLMNALYEIQIDDTKRESQKLAISYGLLKSASKFKWFKPCVKQYLVSHVRSRFLYIPTEHWDTALMLPTERFQKEAKGIIWAESREKVRRG